MATYDLDYTLDASPKLNFSVPNFLLLGSGPCNISHRVRYALSSQCLQPFSQEIFEIMDEIKIMLQYIFQTRNSMTLAIQTSGNGGIEAIIVNLLDPGDKILVANGGTFGDIVVNIARRHDLDVRTIFTNPGETFSLDELEAGLIQHKPDLLWITHGESSVGTIQNLEGLGLICHRYNCLLAVDAVSSLGVQPIFVDRWKIDAICAAGQKGLGAPTGMCMLTLSPRAQNCMETKRKMPPYYLDLKQTASYFSGIDNKRFYHYTISSNMLAAVREALAQICEEGLENVWIRHETNAKLLWEGLNKIGFEFFVKNPENRFFGIHCVNIPSNVDEAKLLNVVKNKYGIEISPGYGPTKGKAMRIGIMAQNSRRDVVEYLIKALGDAREILNSRGCYNG